MARIRKMKTEPPTAALYSNDPLSSIADVLDHARYSVPHPRKKISTSEMYRSGLVKHLSRKIHARVAT